MKWLWKLTGGRPMKIEDCAFIDRVTHKEVFNVTDKLGRRWLANGSWSIFRIPKD